MKNQRTILLVCSIAWNVAAADAPPPQKTNDVHQRALEVLRRLEGFDKKQIPMPQPPPPPTKRQPTAAEVEQFYLEGKITAREYQKYLEDHRLDPARVPNHDSQAKAIDVLHNETNKPGGVQTKPSAPVGRDALATRQPDRNEVTLTPEQSNLSDLEKKMDELLRLKAAREAAATNNAASNTATNAPGPVAPKSKRDRLNELLKLYIDGKIPDAEYKGQRAKLVAEPD